MKLFNVASYVCLQNFRKWLVDYRVWIIAILLFMFTQIFTKEIIEFSKAINIDVTPWIFPFLFT